MECKCSGRRYHKSVRDEEEFKLATDTGGL